MVCTVFKTIADFGSQLVKKLKISQKVIGFQSIIFFNLKINCFKRII